MSSMGWWVLIHEWSLMPSLKLGIWLLTDSGKNKPPHPWFPNIGCTSGLLKQAWTLHSVCTIFVCILIGVCVIIAIFAIKSDTDFFEEKKECSELTSKGSAEDTLLLQDKIRESSVMEREMTGEIILYQPDATLSLQVKLDAAHDTVWLATSQMSQLFGKDESTIRRHILHIFDEEELPKDNNVHFLHVNGIKKPVPFYSLDVIIG